MLTYYDSRYWVVVAAISSVGRCQNRMKPHTRYSQCLDAEKSAHGTWRRTPTDAMQEHPDELEKHAELKDKGVIT